MANGHEILGFANDIRTQVLVVEDESVQAKAIVRLFKSQGVQVDLATSGEQALDMHLANGYRLVVSDWQMPGISGTELCKRIRQSGGPYVYFILATINTRDVDNRTEAYQAGVDDFLNKPINKAEFQDRITVARRILSMEEKLQQRQVALENNANSLREMNQNLQNAYKRFASLFQGLPVPCFTFDRQGIVQDWNYAATKAFGLGATEALSTPLVSMFGSHDPVHWTSDELASIFISEASREFDWKYSSPNGETRFLTSSVICLPDISGRSKNAVCVSLDTTERTLAARQIENQWTQINAQKRELERMNEQLNHLAVTDGLTGLWNHRKFVEVLEDAIMQHNRSDEQFSLILIDVDHFKKYNDVFGHQAGDEALTEFARILKDNARNHELPARYGGEEFAIVLRQCGEEEAMIAAERFRVAIENHTFPHRKVTGSFGVATCCAGRIDSRTIISQADIALYSSKASGRNKSTHYQTVVGRSAPRNI